MNRALILSVGAFISLLTPIVGGQSAQPAAQPSPARFTEPRLSIAAADCVAAKLGDAIPSSAIAEPAGSITLGEPRWVPAADPLPARCEVDGRIAPVDSAAAARPINFRVWLPAEWNRRAVQQGVMLFAPVGFGGASVKLAPPLMIAQDALREGMAVIEEAFAYVIETQRG